MVDHVAVLSDVHGVLPALTAVLAEPDVAAELIVLTGDGLPMSVTLEVRGLGEVLFCHATPRDDEEDDEEFVLVDGPLDRRTNENPGGAVVPYGTTGAHRALLGGADGPAIQVRRTLYDRAAAADAIDAECAFPGVAEWTRYFVREPASDTEALAVFSPTSRPADGPLG